VPHPERASSVQGWCSRWLSLLRSQMPDRRPIIAASFPQSLHYGTVTLGMSVFGSAMVTWYTCGVLGFTQTSR
jgi:hypothetical protein